MRYIPALNGARAHAARMASGDILIYIDADAVVEAGWLEAILEPFSHPRVAAVSGLSLPWEEETAAQERFERHCGFECGFARRNFDYRMIPAAAARMCARGSNIAFRRSVALDMDLFDVEANYTTPAESLSDTYAFYLLLEAGFQVVYTPNALLRHCRHRDDAALRRTLIGSTIVRFAFLIRCLREHGDWQALGVAADWLRADHLDQVTRTLKRHPDRLPLNLVLGQLAALLRVPSAYSAARRRTRSKATAAQRNHAEVR